MWTGWLDRTMRNIINEVIDDFKEEDLTFDQVAEIFNITFGGVAYCISDTRMPKILFKEGLGYFEGDIGKIGRIIKKEKTKEKPREDLNILEETLNRIKTDKKNMILTKSGKNKKNDGK